MLRVIVRCSSVAERAIGISLLAALPFAAACGSTAETVTGPTQTRCGVQIQAETGSFTPDGGKGTLRVTANRECGWAAQSEAPWVTLSDPQSGQGDGTVQFTVAVNATPASRTTSIKVEDQRLAVAQEGRPCGYRLSATVETVEASGGDRTVQVTTTTPQCRWTAVSDVPWITITSGREGDDTGPVTFHVDALSGPQRTGTLNIAGQVVQVQQGAGCSYAIGTDTFSIGSAGGTGDVPVTAPAGCAWTAQSAVPWITLTTGSTGSGPGVVSFRVAATDGPLRTGTLTVAGRTVTVTQSPGCTYTVEPLSYSAPVAASTSMVAVRAAGGCGWTASSALPWVVITAGATGNGAGEVRFNVAANPGPARSGALQIAGQSVAITQASGCTIAVSPTTLNVSAGGTSASIQVTGAQGCPWSATTTTPWIALSENSSGSGHGQVPFTVAANTGPARQGAISIAGQQVTVSQVSGCTYTVTPTSQDVPPGGTTGTAQIATGAGCPWTASSNTEWIAVNTRSGTGPAQVPFTVASNSGPSRTGTLTVADTVINVSQGSQCLWAFFPRSHNFNADGGNGNILVVVTGACTWTAQSDVPWIAVTSGDTGTGNGLVQFTAAANPGPGRTGTLTIAGQKYEVTQGSR